jgi:hypothetical protein
MREVLLVMAEWWSSVVESELLFYGSDQSLQTCNFGR